MRNFRRWFVLIFERGQHVDDTLCSLADCFFGKVHGNKPILNGLQEMYDVDYSILRLFVYVFAKEETCGIYSTESNVCCGCFWWWNNHQRMVRNRFNYQHTLSQREIEREKNGEKKNFTYYSNFTTSSSTMTLLISRPACVHTRVILFLHRIDDERTIVLHLLSNIVGQFTPTWLFLHRRHHQTQHRWRWWRRYRIGRNRRERERAREGEKRRGNEWTIETVKLRAKEILPWS